MYVGTAIRLYLIIYECLSMIRYQRYVKYAEKNHINKKGKINMKSIFLFDSCVKLQQNMGTFLGIALLLLHVK